MTRKTATCPQCGRTTKRDENNPLRPFCSERCRLIDLGSWLDGTHRIPTDEPADYPDADSNGGEPTQH
ncbi:MAG: DNA gyrase inhibitor YacG [Gammaproteobacteria bacterium]|nr:DNA gyrase inhibitor YacG [Gammaproteobacteria bacterium]